ncbi:hypothetical protein SeMB42_g06347 [Synchytrium endobioticum]|uniref:non-specific serine/threonine protein kinase n=1 Tax=Synchytrium endobioticum TaxID=286115 RepID=A0A507CM56_9FUNG|nr:hypothetical protein SeMB42_g06347 [Synchytrium endobioticum]
MGQLLHLHRRKQSRPYTTTTTNVHRYALPTPIIATQLSLRSGPITPCCCSPISPKSFRSTSSQPSFPTVPPFVSATQLPPLIDRKPQVRMHKRSSLESDDTTPETALSRHRKRMRQPAIDTPTLNDAEIPRASSVSPSRISPINYPTPVSPSRATTATAALSSHTHILYTQSILQLSFLTFTRTLALSRHPPFVRRANHHWNVLIPPAAIESAHVSLHDPHNIMTTPSDVNSVAHTDVKPCEASLGGESGQGSGKDISEVISDNGARKWVLLKPLGKGGCGEVFLGREYTTDSELTPGPLVALKFVKDRKQFNAELTTMKLLNFHKNGRGHTPQLIHACRKDRVLVMEYLSDSLGKKFESLRFTFSLKTVLMLSINMLKLAKDFHERTGLVHVDIKPSNFMTRDRELFMIDFGYAGLPHAKLPGQTGTPLFMSRSIQSYGSTFPCVMDDLESIGYCVMFWIGKGKKGLPWGHLRSHRDIAAAKTDEAISSFCSNLVGTEYGPISSALEKYLFFTRDRNRNFEPNEDYDYLVGLLENVMVECGWKNDGRYDWLGGN